MTLLEAIDLRHSVRDYIDVAIEEEKIKILQEEIDKINAEGNLHTQLVTNEPLAFTKGRAKIGHFTNVKNYILMIGEKTKDLDFKCGYYGERLVLLAQTLGLNTCWVGLTYKPIKGTYTIGKKEKLCIAISIGYGENQGFPHKNRDPFSVCNYVKDESPLWFKHGVVAALKGPTAMNQQRFYFELLEDETVHLESTRGYFVNVDLGIVKYHFELGSENKDIKWDIELM